MKRMLQAVLLACFAGLMTVNAEVKVIVNSKVALTALEAKEVENLFLGRKKKLPNGTKAIPVDLSVDAVHEEFLKQYVKRSPSQYKSHWKKAVFTGKGKPPQALKTDAEVVAFVAATPGAIGYVGGDADVSGVTVLSVN